MVALMKYRDSIDHILIEASGVSYPSRIMDFARIDPDLRPGMTLVLIDAANLAAQRADPKLAEVIAAQMDGADMFLLTKQTFPAKPRSPKPAAIWPRHNRWRRFLWRVPTILTSSPCC